MTTSSRSTQFTKIHKVLKKHYTPVAPNPDRPVLEHLVFACCLENARYESAEDALASVQEAFFDWNEVRVSSVRELAEVMVRLPDPPAAAVRMKKALQHVFEDSYTFDLEPLRKKNLGPAAEELRKIKGTTPFVVSYVVQSALGGHSIPIDSGAARVFEILNLATETDIASGVVPGLERAIAKNKGTEFGSLLHQLGADVTDDPFAGKIHKILLEIDPDCKDRLPSRPAVKKKTEKLQEVESEEKDLKKADKTSAAKAAGKKTPKTPSITDKKAASQKKPDFPKQPKAKAAKKKIVMTQNKPSPAPQTDEKDPSKTKTAETISKRKPR